MSQSATRVLLEDLPEDEPWPPVPPDIDNATLEVETPELAVSANSMLYRVKGNPFVVYRFKGDFRGYQLQEAAGDCSIPVRGRVLGRLRTGLVAICFYGFMMDLAIPLTPTALSPPQRRNIADQMIQTVQRLHVKGIIHGDLNLENMLLDNQRILRLCDFGEGRYLEEDEQIWGGKSTWHFESSNRFLRGGQLGRDPPVPTVKDDQYGLGLSIWQLYTGKTQHEDLVCCDLELKERQREGGTVDVSMISDEGVRDIVTEELKFPHTRLEIPTHPATANPNAA